MYYFQEKFYFNPTTLPASHKFTFKQPFREVNIPYKKDATINIVQFLTEKTNEAQGDSNTVLSNAGDVIASTEIDSSIRGTSKGLVLYFHGNRDNIEHYAPASTMFTRNGYEIWMMDYPGFGKSTGEMTEDVFYEYALTTYKLARTRFKPSEIVIYGRSLGTGVASQLASVRDCRALILETPFASLYSLIGYYAPAYPVKRIIRNHFDVYEHLKKVAAPVTIFAGSEDLKTPIANSKRLREVLKPGDQFIIVEGGHHNDLPQFPLFNEKLDSLLN